MFSYYTSNKVIILLILVIFLLDYMLIMLGAICRWSLLGLKGLSDCKRQNMKEGKAARCVTVTKIIPR